MGLFDRKTSKDKEIKGNNNGDAANKKEKKKTLKPVLKKEPKIKKAKAIPPFVTIDIGCCEIKIMVASHNSGLITVTHAASEILPENAIDDGKIIEEGYVANCIRNMMSENNIKVSNAVITMNSTEITQREIIVPKVPNNELTNLVTFEMGKYLPINPSAYAIQYNIIEELEGDSGGTSLRVNVCAMPKSIAKGYLDLLSKLGLNPMALNMHSTSVAKLIGVESNRESPLLKGSSLVVDMGHEHFNAMMFNDGKLIFNRLIETGGSKIDEVIMRIADVDLAEARRIKRYNLSKINALDMYKSYLAARGSSDNSYNKEELISQETVVIYNGWITDIESVIKYYLSRNSENVVDTIYIDGGSSYIKGIDELIENRLNIRTKRLNNFNCLKGILCDGNRNEDISKYVNNIGATIRI